MSPDQVGNANTVDPGTTCINPEEAGGSYKNAKLINGYITLSLTKALRVCHISS